MATLSPIEIDIGRKVVSCLRVFQTHLIFLFCSTIMPFAPSLEVFHCPVCILFGIYGRIRLLSLLNIFCFSSFKMFQVPCNYRDSLFFVYSFCIVLLLKITIAVTSFIRGYRSKSLLGDTQRGTDYHILIVSICPFNQSFNIV